MRGIVTVPENMVERNIELTGEIMQHLLSHPEIFDALPDQFELVILPEDDPEVRSYNLELLDQFGSEGKPNVFARIQSRHRASSAQISPSLFIPLPTAV
jgi:hypothetical protein